MTDRLDEIKQALAEVLKANQVTLHQAQAIHDYLLLTHPYQAVDELELENEIVKKLAEGSIR